MLHVLLHATLLATWFLAASISPAAAFWRWPLLAIVLPVAIITRWGTRGPVRLPQILLPLLLLVAYGLVLGVVSRSPALALAKCTAFGATTLSCVMGGSSFVERFGRDRVLRVWEAIFLAGAVAAEIAALAGVMRTGPEGLYGPTGNPNMFGSIIISIGVVAIASVFERGWTPRVVLGVLAASALLLATRSRASIFGIIVGCVAAVALARGARRRAWTWALVVVAAGALVWIPQQAVRGVEFVSEGTSAREVFQTRLGNWEVSWDAMKAGLPFGLGWGVKDGIHREWRGETTSFGREEGTSWLPIGEELGIPGILLVAWLWVALARAARASPSRTRVLGGACIAMYAGLATFEGWFLAPGNWESAAFWTTIGICFCRPQSAPVAPAPLSAPLEAAPVLAGSPS